MKKLFLKESPDSIPKNLTYDKYGDPYVNYADLDYSDDDPSEEYVNFDSYDAHAFWIDDDEVFMSRSTETHLYRIKRDVNYYPGRIWVNAKIISFWYYPDNKKLHWILKKLNKELEYYYPDRKWDLLNDDGWLIEVPKTRNKELPWKAYDYFKSELVPIGEYNNDIDNSYARSEEDLAKQHILSPLLKQKQFKKGWGSSSTKYVNNRIWQMAAPISDNYNINKNIMQSLYEFEKGVDPKVALGIGVNSKVQQLDELEEYREEDEEIIKSFYIQDIMSPVIFDKEEVTYVMRSNIKTKLLDITEEFLDFIGIDFDVEDIVLTGSLANFNWSKYSDVDLHIIIDFGNTKHNIELLKELFDAKKNIWNSQHNILVAGYEVELYIQDSAETHSSSGIYSLTSDDWLVEPSSEKYDINKNLILEKGDDYMKIIDELLDEFKSNIDVTDEVGRIQNKIKKFRKSGLETGGEYSYENLTFKLLRRNGYIKKLFDLKRDIIDKKLSLK